MNPALGDRFIPHEKRRFILMPLHASFWSGGNVLQPVTQRYEEQPVTPKLDTHEWKAFAHEPQESNKRLLKRSPQTTRGWLRNFGHLPNPNSETTWNITTQVKCVTWRHCILGWIETK